MSLQRKFIPGDEWIFYKIYAGIAIQQKILMGEIFQVVNLCYKNGWTDKFFFIRYDDHEGPHIRLRFHVTAISNLPEVMQIMHQLLKAYIDNRMISKVVLDTYNREIERYGAGNIENAETVFSVNSWTILSLRKLSGEDLWLAGVKMADDMLDDMGYDLAGKHTLCKTLYDSAGKRLQEDAGAREKLKARYRENTAKMISRMDTPLTYGISREYQQEAFKQIVACSAEGGPSTDNIAGSMLHMLFNRLFATNQNLTEVVIYYMLHKFYNSEIARLKVEIH